MLTVDLHTHILPESWPDLRARFGYGGWVSLEPCGPAGPDGRCGKARMIIDGRFFREIDRNCWDPETRLREIDELAGPGGVQVLSTVPVMFSYWARPADALALAQLLNDHLAGVVARQPRRFVGLGTIPMQDPDRACRELERCVLPPARGGLGLAGVQIGTHVECPEGPRGPAAPDVNLGDRVLRPIFETAERLGAAVFVHPWDMMGRTQMERYWLPWLVGMPAETSRAICSMIFGGVLEAFPRLRVAFAHGGGSFPATLGRIEAGFMSRPDLVAIDNPVNPRLYVAHDGPDGVRRPARFWVDSLTHDADALRYLISVMDARRVALGSDYPFPLGEARPGAMIRSMPDLDETTRARLLGGSALEFLGLDASIFSDGGPTA